MEKIRVGVIGVGAMGKHHVRIYHGMRDVELVGVADSNERTANEIAAEYHTEAFTDCEQLLNKKDLDAVSIAVPTSLHKEIARKAAQYGVHMLVEKPIADSLSNAVAIIDAARRENLKLMIGHIERFNPAILKLKELIAAGELGQVLSISCRRVGPYAPRIRDVGIITDLAVHDIDTISYLYGKRAMQVYSIAGNSFHVQEDYASILLKYDDKRSGTVETNWLTPYKMRTLTATGTGGVASVDYLEQSLELWKEEGRISVEIEKGEPLKIELAQFVAAVSNGKEPSPLGEEGEYVLSVAIAAIESYKNGNNVRLNAA
ncbi:MAG: Gfo/Idh/MocA family oxidoreductase [Euryarchaeota archaeon]|nr:Gfo/Idh/MocA family oxidoreductase [Euryarchaeota archaeon]